MSILPTGISLGPLTLPPYVIGLILALVLVLNFAKRDFNKRGLAGEAWSDTLLYTVIAWWLGARLSAFVLEPAASFSQPFTTFLAGGVPYTEDIGTVVCVLYFIWRVRNLQLPWGAVLSGLARVAVLAVAVMSLFEAAAGQPTGLPWGVTIGGADYHPINLYLAGAAWLLFAWLVFGKKDRGEEADQSHADFFRVLFWLGSALLVLSFFQIHLERAAGLAPSQWVWLGMTVAGYAGPLVWKPSRSQ